MLPGVYENMPNREYHACRDWISSSNLKTVAGEDGLLAWVNEQQAGGKERTDAMRFGTAAHGLILEGIEPEVSPYKDFRSKAAKAWREEHAEANWVTGKEHDRLRGMLQAVGLNPDVELLQQAGRRCVEVSIFWHGPENVQCRCRPDMLILPEDESAAPIIVDYKTTQSAGPAGFAKEISKQGYDQQAAFYIDGVASAYPRREQPRFAFLAQEKTAPYMCCLHFLEQEAIGPARGLNDACIKEILMAEQLQLHKNPGVAWSMLGNSSELQLPAYRGRDIERRIEAPQVEAPF